MKLILLSIFLLSTFIACAAAPVQLGVRGSGPLVAVGLEHWSMRIENIDGRADTWSPKYSGPQHFLTSAGTHSAEFSFRSSVFASTRNAPLTFTVAAEESIIVCKHLKHGVQNTWRTFYIKKKGPLPDPDPKEGYYYHCSAWVAVEDSVDWQLDALNKTTDEFRNEKGERLMDRAKKIGNGKIIKLLMDAGFR